MPFSTYVFVVPRAQNNQYINVTYLGVACSELLHHILG